MVVVPKKKSSKVIDLEGRVFSKMTVLEFMGLSRPGYRAVWRCQCECGRIKSVRGDDLRSGKIHSCGCLGIERRREATVTHGRSRSSEYKIWYGMKERCYNPGIRSYKDYGARGIKVCKRWRESFENFLGDMGERPSNTHSIERIDNDKGYSPKNCKWATSREQTRNARSNKVFIVKGKRILQVDLARVCRVNKSTIQYRVKQGWSAEEMLTYYTKRLKRGVKTP